MTRALVTGAAGFVGANVARRLLADGHDVHLLDRPGSRQWRIADLTAHANLHEADLEDPDAVTRVLEEARPEWIFHLAARGAYSWQGDVREILVEVEPGRLAAAGLSIADVADRVAAATGAKLGGR